MKLRLGVLAERRECGLIGFRTIDSIQLTVMMVTGG